MKKLLAFFLMIVVSGFAQDTTKIKIACIGNSITSYTGNPDYPSPDSYPWQMRYLFGDGYDIQNFGVSGTTMLKHGDVSYWDEDAFSDALAFEPDIVTIMLGTNDSKPQNYPVFPNEFIDDYKAMIDTFQALPSHPDIYLCVPAKAFSNKYDITDSVIVNYIKPDVEQIAADLNLPLIDFYAFTSDKPYLSYDGIHPTMNGLWEYAKGIYLGITGKEAPATQRIHDINLVKGSPVTIQGIETFVPITEMTDNDYFTNFPLDNGAVVELALAEADSIDMVQVLVGGHYTFSYKVETSLDQTTWTEQGTKSEEEVAGSALAFNAVDAQFVKVTFNSEEPGFKVAEIKVLRKAPVHAPVITFVVDNANSRMARYFVDIYAATEGAPMRYCYMLEDSTFDGGIAFRSDSTLQYKHNVKTDTHKEYFTIAYADGFEALSDTFYVDFDISSVQMRGSTLPTQFGLHQNYPNPFNPSTVIEYDLNRFSHVRLSVFDCTGRLIERLVNERQQAGAYRAVFDASNLSSGLYFYTLEADNHKTTRKMVVMH